MSDNLNLNSIQRFRKQSERLVLEQYSHCEVPAGCGGVVLRWLNPRVEQRFVIWMHTPVEAEATVQIGGKAAPHSHVDLPVGRHVLTMALSGVDLSACLLLFAGTNATNETPPPLPIHVLSADDGTWRYTLSEPPPNFTESSFDDAAWPALVKLPTPELSEREGAYFCQKCVEHGAVCLGLPPSAARAKGAGHIWVRKVFDVVAPRVGGEAAS